MRRLITRILLAGLVIALVVFALVRVAGRQEQRPNIRTVQIGRGDLTLTVNATGSVVAEQSVRLSFKTPGIVNAVLVEEGQPVKAGEALARLDDTAQALLVAQAEANLQAARLRLEQVLAPPTAAEIEVAEANVRAAQGAYNALFSAFTPEAIRAAELQYQKAQTVAQDAVQRRKDTGGQVSTESEQYQLALAQEGQASFAAEIARLQLEMLRRGPDARAVASARARIDEAKAKLEQLQAGVPQAQVDQAQLGVRQAELALEQAQIQLENTVLRAPFDGIVTLITARVGSIAAANLPAFVVTDTSRLYVNVRVDEIDIGQLQPGQDVALAFDALPGQRLPGTVDRIALMANQEGMVTTYDVRVALDPGSSAVKVGMTASATITVRSLSAALRVPNLFVRLDRRTNQAFVNRVNPDGSLTEIPITLGLRTEEYSEVVAGLAEGDTIGIDLSTDLLSLFE